MFDGRGKTQTGIASIRFRWVTVCATILGCDSRLFCFVDSKEYNINEIFGKTKKVKKLEKVEDVKESGEERENSFKLKPDEKVNLIDLEKKLTVIFCG